MTEQEWWESGTLARFLTVWGADTLAAPRDRAYQRVLAILGEQATDRKLRLFAVAVCHRIASGLLLGPALRGLAVAEQIADGTASPEEGDRARQQLGDLLADEVARNSYKPPEYAASAPLTCLHQNAREAVRYAVPQAWHTSQPPREKVWGTETAARLRDIFGNPFRPVAFDRAWRTSTVAQLARGMYESRDYGAMPILADALQDAGCDSDDVLNHCRDENATHVRGCWVVDLVLGKA